MTSFEESNWGQAAYTHEYRDNADNQVLERATLLRVVASFYCYFVRTGDQKRILDLGCGDGIVSRTLYAQDHALNIVAVDGSLDMLQAAKMRLAGLPVSAFCQVTFEDIINGKFMQAPFDFIASSLAIHHLEFDGKVALFKRIFELLKPGGYFLNADIGLPEHSPYTEWYHELWREWIILREQQLNLKESFADTPEKARRKPENRYDGLQRQLDALKTIGFVHVDCHYKYGMFTVYGGQRPGAV
jgi:tRNA (cmo5U34)-methyltransferase